MPICHYGTASLGGRHEGVSLKYVDGTRKQSQMSHEFLAKYNVMCDFNVAADWYISIVIVRRPVSFYAHICTIMETM